MAEKRAHSFTEDDSEALEFLKRVKVEHEARKRKIFIGRERDLICMKYVISTIFN